MRSEKTVTYVTYYVMSVLIFIYLYTNVMGIFRYLSKVAGSLQGWKPQVWLPI